MLAKHLLAPQFHQQWVLQIERRNAVGLQGIAVDHGLEKRDEDGLVQLSMWTALCDQALDVLPILIQCYGLHLFGGLSIVIVGAKVEAEGLILRTVIEKLVYFLRTSIDGLVPDDLRSSHGHNLKGVPLELEPKCLQRHIHICLYIYKSM